MFQSDFVPGWQESRVLIHFSLLCFLMSISMVWFSSWILGSFGLVLRNLSLSSISLAVSVGTEL